MKGESLCPVQQPESLLLAPLYRGQPVWHYIFKYTPYTSTKEMLFIV